MVAFDPSSLTVQFELGTPGAMVPGMSAITWWRNIDVLFDGAEYRGEDKVIPHRVGRLAQARHVDSKVVTLEGLIRGQVDIAASPYANAVAGLQSNLNYLEYYCTPRLSPEADRTRRLRLVSPLGVKYGPVHATFTKGAQAGPGLHRITLEISMPEGGLWS